MPTLTATSFLQRNIESLGSRNRDLAERLASASPSGEFTLIESADGVPAIDVGGRMLCSRVHPLKEAHRLVDGLDLVEHAVVVVLGFGAGWHVKRLAERSEKSTLIVVFEPDLSLLRTVLEHVDHSSWMRDALLVFITDADDRGALAAKLVGAESIVGQGVHVLEHPPSRERLGEQATRFARNFSEQVAAARTTLATTLMRSVDTTRNLLRNVDHYVGGAGIAELEGAAAGWPALIVSAGPSLHRNMALLADERVRQQCVIVAVQTALLPLLHAGIKPHFVTALDYHEISRRFYESLDATLLHDVTLIADPKVHPVVLDIYPGPVRCCANGFLDRLLGKAARPMGELPAGATVAHLAMYFARYLGCDPVAMIGQDLGFPDGLYYAPGAVIHDTWAPELNAFNTIAMMEWQRIARHRLHLIRTQDVHGRTILTDAQMHTYLQQFERDFAGYVKRGWTTVDATEGGVNKQHTLAMPLREFIHRFAQRELPAMDASVARFEPARLVEAHQSIAGVRRKIEQLRQLSADTEGLLAQMLEHQRDQARMATLFKRVEANRREVEKAMDAFELLNMVNQMGAFRRMRADRRLHMSRGLDELAVQRLQIERDLDNVRWLAEAATEMLSQMDDGMALLGESDRDRTDTVATIAASARSHSSVARSDVVRNNNIAALVPIDPNRNGRGIARSLAEPFMGRPVLQVTLERLGRSQTIGSIVLSVPDSIDVEPLLDRTRIGLPVEIERCDGESPFGPEQKAVAVARMFADTCWRGGIAGIGVHDEALCPRVMHEVMRKRELTAALIVAPDWPLIDITGEAGCDAIVRRHLESPLQHNLVFTQSPPGITGCLVSASLMGELAQRNRLSTVGGLLVYQPHAPQHDPIARDACVQAPHRCKTSLARATFDSKRWRRLFGSDSLTIKQVDAACELAYERSPQHVVLELTTERASRGVFAKSLGAGVAARSPIDLATVRMIFDGLAALGEDDLTLTLHGAGDPLLHSHFDEIIVAAKNAGIRAVNLRTELLCDQRTLDRLLASGVDVVSVDVNADRAVTYMAMMAIERFKDVLLNIDYLVSNRRRFTEHSGAAAFALPWIVPHLQRRAETYEDIDTFFDRWQHTLGTAVIDDPPPGDPRSIGLTPAVTPLRVRQREAMRRLTILSDTSVPIMDMDFGEGANLGQIGEHSIGDHWRTLREQRARAYGASTS